MRKLASVQIINEIKDIPNADKVVMARVLGYECVIKKDEMKVGDLGVYFEVDSLLPEKPEFEFLRDGKFRIKIRKFRGQVSMGLFMPLNILPKGDYKEGDDVTDILGVKNYEKMLEEANDQPQKEYVPKSPIVQYLMNYAVFRKVYFLFNQKIKGDWPSWISKTDEVRLAAEPKLLMHNVNRSFYITEKMDGSSATFFAHKIKKWKIFNSFIYGVCSRNRWLKTSNTSSYWFVANKYDILNKLKKLKKEIVIQGEVCGPKIQANKYHLSEYELYIFNIKENGRLYSVDEMINFCQEHGLKHVPVLDKDFAASFGMKSQNEIMDEMVEMSKGKSVIYDILREGIVVRLNDDPKISFKVINPDFLLAVEKKREKDE